MSASVTPIPSTDLSRTRFLEVMDLVRRRKLDPEAQAALEQEPDIAVAWKRFQDGLDKAAAFMDSALRYCRTPEEARTRSFSHALRDPSRAIRFYRPVSKDTVSADLAVLLGELSRVARLDETARKTDQTARVSLQPTVRAMLADEPEVEGLYPLMAVASDALVRLQRTDLADDQPGVALPVLLDATRDLATLHDAIDYKSAKLLHRNVGTGFLPDLGKRLAGPAYLPLEQFPYALEEVYDRSWHTHTKTKSPTGAFVHRMYDRLRSATPALPADTRRQTEALLVAMAGISNGDCREIAGISSVTPEPVYNKLIYDNSLGVLSGVVQNPAYFNNDKAYAMLDTGLAPQTIAVMKHGRVDLAVRILACQRAIAHEGVSPMHVYEFLRDNARGEHVPEALRSLWHDLVLEVHRRLTMVRVHGTPKQIERFENQLGRFANLFLTECFAEYHAAAQEQAKLAKRIEDNDRAIARETRSYARDQLAARGRQYAQQLLVHRRVLDAHTFVRDGALLDVLVEGLKDAPRQLLTLLKYCVEAEVPVTRKLVATVCMHPDDAIREQARGLLPNANNGEAEKAAAEVEALVEADYARVRDFVFTNVIPDYEGIAGTPRPLSRMHRHFLAATEIPLEDLVSTFVAAAEKDPRTIPDALAQLTRRKRMGLPLQDRLDAALESPLEPSDAADVPRMRTNEAPVEPVVLEDLDRMTQGDLFGAFDGPVSSGPAASAMVKKPGRAR